MSRPRPSPIERDRLRVVEVSSVTPILNVSDLRGSFEWFAKLGWTKRWDWCPPDADEPTFGAVASGEHEIFLCLDAQGGRGEHGAWMSLWSTTSMRST